MIGPRRHSHAKLWLDEVLSYGWAYGGDTATALRTARAMQMPTSVAVPAYFSPPPSGQQMAMASPPFASRFT